MCAGQGRFGPGLRRPRGWNGQMWNVVLGRVAFFVRAQMEIYEKVTG